jgi:hypothetical protein
MAGRFSGRAARIVNGTGTLPDRIVYNSRRFGTAGTAGGSLPERNE